MSTTLFKKSEELKPHVSGVDITLDLENITSSLKTASRDVKEAVSPAIWAMVLEHYNSTDFNVDEQAEDKLKRLDELTGYLQTASASFALYHHFIWLQIRVKNDGVTVVDSENEKAAFRYQTDEAKEELIKAAWAAINEAVLFLNENATKWETWKAETTYTVDSIISAEAKYYKCLTEHASTVFADDAANWEEVAKTDIVFVEWTTSEAYTDTQSLFFDSEREFSKYFNIENSAWFYMRIAYIIREVMEEEVASRFEDFEGLMERKALGKLDKSELVLLKKLKKAVAYKAVAAAILQFSAHELPSGIRGELREAETVRRRGSKSETIPLKVSIAAPIERKAEQYFEAVDMYLRTQEEINTDTDPEAVGYEVWEDAVADLEDDKFFSV